MPYDSFLTHWIAGSCDCLFSDSYRHWYMGNFQNERRGAVSFGGDSSLNQRGIGFSMWGTNVGPSMLIAPPSAGFLLPSTIVSGNYAWYAFVFICLLAFVFAPATWVLVFPPCPEFMGKQFGHSTVISLTWYTIVTIVISSASMTLLF